MKTYTIPEYKIVVHVVDGGVATIESGLKEHLVGNETPEDNIVGAVNALESLILAHRPGHQLAHIRGWVENLSGSHSQPFISITAPYTYITGTHPVGYLDKFQPHRMWCPVST